MRLFRSIDNLERRRAPRSAADAVVCCAIRDPRTAHLCLAAIRDISSTGIALLADQPFEVGELLTIELQHAKREVVRKYLIEVRHADICYPNDAWLHGCRLIRPLRDDELRFWL